MPTAGYANERKVPGFARYDPKYEKKGREKHIEKQEQWNQFLGAGQGDRKLFNYF